MHPAAAQALFAEETAAFTQALAARRAWTFHTVAFPMIDCSFSAMNRTPLRLCFTCDDWNDLPPSISLHSLDGALLMQPLTNTTGVFHPGPHPGTRRLFICMRGAREYHTHPSHVGDHWSNVRGQSSFTLGGILTQVWHAWLKGSG
jgi:hypothetical protein